MIERLWPVLAVIERCAVDLPELEALYFQRGRPGHLAQLVAYLERGQAGGHLRTCPTRRWRRASSPRPSPGSPGTDARTATPASTTTRRHGAPSSSSCADALIEPSR